MAAESLFVIPRINEIAPDFEAKSTHGLIRLSDFTQKGKWILLFSHPADFTPVCTSEFVALARRYDDLKKRNVQPIGVSIDSIYSHIAWVRMIEENFDIKVQFPVIADLDQKVARAYGMVHEAVADTTAVRAIFYIDPKRMVRALLYYPPSLGRNIDEVLRVFDALQTADVNSCATPANWEVGDDVILPAPVTQQAAAERVKGGKDLEVTDWFCTKKKISRLKKKKTKKSKV